MIENIELHFQNFNFDVRLSKDARFMDQKVTPDVLCIIADCVLNFVADRDVEFTKNDIWNDEYFNTNVKDIFNKPDAQNNTARQEYDKFTSQPLRTLAYAGVLSLRKKGKSNLYKIQNQSLLEYIGLKERNAYVFLYHYLTKVLRDSDLLRHFQEFRQNCLNKTVNNEIFQALKIRFQRFIIGNTPINGKTEVNRIFPKILNVFSCENNIEGTIKGFLSKRQIYYTDLMYNRANFRDINKVKTKSRNEAVSVQEKTNNVRAEAYSKYQVQKAMNMIRKLYSQSEINDQWANGEATQVHHIFSKSEFPRIAHYFENLIKLTPTQHFTKAHPNNKTQQTNRDYQLICLLAKSDSIEQSLKKMEFIYRKESFIYVINEGLSESLETNIDFKTIKSELTYIYNSL